MPRAPPPGFYVLSAVALFIWYIIWSHNRRPITGFSNPSNSLLTKTDASNHGSDQVPLADLSTPLEIDPSTLHGEAIAPKLGNETAKALLGRSAWHLLHTTMSRFPDTPTADESTALKSYIHLFARLYPCGECARHFQQILAKYPPQVGSRSAAAGWACFVHNEVNVSKGKPVFDCAKIGDWYDCGCAEDEKKTEKGSLKGHEDDKEKVRSGKSLGEDVEVEREGLMNGG